MPLVLRRAAAVTTIKFFFSGLAPSADIHLQALYPIGNPARIRRPM
jgi:hypothetical protein